MNGIESSKLIDKNVTVLNRGGYLVCTSIGNVQFGSPPETIKDTMIMDSNVPQIYVLGSKLFDWIKGISVAEIEFPIYYNYFIRQKKTTIICTEDQFNRMKKVLSESLFGPNEFDLSVDFQSKYDTFIPDLSREMKYFRQNRKLSDLVSFGIFKNNKFTIKGVTVKQQRDKSFVIIDHGKKIANVPDKIEYKPTYDIGERLSEPYMPSLFGVTCLGPSHGFDPSENTSGFIIWLNHQGTMVDPPVNSTEWLIDSNVNPKYINTIILTHCHADHDAGTFQKILEEGKVIIYTTETIMMSFLRKYSSLSNVPISYLMELFEFRPVKIGKAAFINGGQFDFLYTLHSIPTIGFKMHFQNQSLVYTSDHNNDVSLHNELLEQDVISRERYDNLQNFSWDSKVIYHEAGIAPLHTPIDYLNSLPVEIQKKIVVYHIAKKDFPKDTLLTLAKFGIENTLYFETKPPKFEKAYQILGLLKHLDIFGDISVEKTQEFLDIVVEEKYKKGDLIIEKGTEGDKFYIIYSGNIYVDSGDSKATTRKIYGAYDYFGEVALITGQVRAADVFAETDLVVYTISMDKFINFIVGTEFERTLQRLSRIRTGETWNLLSKSKFFRHCTSTQKTWIESIFIPVEDKAAGVLIQEGGKSDYLYIIKDGEVEVSKGSEIVATLKRGDLIGSLQNVHRDLPDEFCWSHSAPISLFAMKRSDILIFVNNNPGLLMKLVHDFI